MVNYGLIHPLVAGAAYTVTQKFGARPEVYAKYNLAGHNGEDFAAATGTVVVAAMSGVAKLYNEGSTGYGRYIEVVAPHMKTVYAHLSEYLVADGAYVAAGQPIGKVGSTGDSTGPHLHFGWKCTDILNPAYINALDPNLGLKMGEIVMAAPIDVIRNAAWQQVKVPYNPDAAFSKYATARSLGVPMTPEFDVQGYRAQGFSLGIVYCLIGDWGNIQLMSW